MQISRVLTCSAVHGVCRGRVTSVFKNNGDGTFTDVSKQLGMDDPQGFYGCSRVASDFGNGGRPDIYVANDSTPNFFYQNEGKGHSKKLA